MQNKETDAAPSHVEPILAVKDINETIDYWHEILGFPNKWTWGEPPNYGGVNWNSISVQFNLAPDLALVSKGNAIFIKVKKLEELYQYHQEKNAVIVEPLENRPWGMAGYTVKEINGYYIIFAGAMIKEKKQTATGLCSIVKIIERIPTVEEYQSLASSVGWHAYNDSATAQKLLEAPIFGLVAKDSGNNRVIGCVLLLSDHASFYYVKDLIVHPDWQGKKIGTALMKEVSHWLENNAANNALVVLITGENLSPFYQQFGFAPAFGMVHYIERDKKR
ncbi:MAG TPA: GNAT family N-acetyltransferase [Chitinophagaceae bacterium]|nr:GNAT family N-acetyltransferase [Chitinophagaceae bacterium]